MTIKDLSKYVGIKYTPMGKTFEDGMDCATLMVAYYAELGYDLKIPTYEYDGNVSLHILKLFRAEFTKLKKEGKIIDTIEKLEPHDMLCFSVGNRRIDLLGVFLEYNKFLFMPHQAKSCIGKLNSIWTARFRYAIRLV